MVNGLADFTQAGNHPESILGKACALVQRAQMNDLREAVGLFESLGLGAPSFVLSVTHTAIGVTNAEAHAFLAWAYYGRGDPGDMDKSLAQINAARQQDSSLTSTVGQIYLALKRLGLPGLT
jgi:hypothetical protein